MRIESVRSLITDKIRGKTLDFVGIQGEYLVIVTTDGQSYRIGWRDSDNILISGSPSLEGIDVMLKVDPLVVTGIAG